MLDVNSVDDIAALRESQDVECKLAQGRDGKGALPKDFWETGTEVDPLSWTGLSL